MGFDRGSEWEGLYLRFVSFNWCMRVIKSAEKNRIRYLKVVVRVSQYGSKWLARQLNICHEE
jgi:hypothetical protein